MITGLSGRLYLSGFFDRLTIAQRDLVHEAIALFKQIRGHTAASIPSWPMGLPDWYADQVALTLTSPDHTLLYLWHRGSEDATFAIDWPGDCASRLVERYPGRLSSWEVTASESGDQVLIKPHRSGPSARIYELMNP